MGRRLTEAEADERLCAAGLEPLEPYVNRATERRCRCIRCGTTRWVKLQVLGSGGLACRWCHGWETWTSWSHEARSRAAAWRPIRIDPSESLAALARTGVIAVTPPGDEFEPIGFLCPTCGETGVTVPERIGDGDRNYYGCPRCSAAHTSEVLAGADAVYEANGLRLLARCRGEYVPQPAECITCGVIRRVSLAALKAGAAPLCWTCTHGIRPDEPHRIYLVHFPALRVMKVGLTHARHDRRLGAHELAGGTVIATAVVADRATARSVERDILDVYRAWSVADICPADFPQGGWTETWSDQAPPLDLPAFAATQVGHPDH